MTSDIRAQTMVGLVDPAAPGNYFSPAIRNAAAVTKSDATIFDEPTQALYVGSTGDVAVTMAGVGTAILFAGVPAGTLLSIAVTQVLSTNTTASSIVRLW